MNNLTMKIKKILSNKNVVTILGFILIGVILIVAYNMRLNADLAPVKIPYAVRTLEPQTKITEKDIDYIEVARDNLSESYYTSKKDIVGKYVKLESTVHEGSFFYIDALAEELPTSAVLNVPDGETLLTLDVDMKTSYYNSLVPGDYFDLYVRTVGILPDEKKGSNEIIVGKLIDKIKILSVKSEDGKNVFSGDEERVPSGVMFSLPEELALLVMKAEYFDELADFADLELAEIEFILIPRGQKYEPQDGETVVSTITSDQLEEYINDKTKDIEINEIKENAKKDE